MHIQEIEKDFLCFTFPPREGKHFGFNIYALLAEGESLLIDSGFREHGEAVGAWLDGQGCPVRRVIVSHFHHDHIFGLKALPGVQVFGSPRFQETFDLYTRPEEQPRFTPQRLLADGDELVCGEHRLRFLLMPGHAACNAYTFIDEHYLHVGDDLMSSNEGAALLPSVELNRIGDHIASLKTLKQFAYLTFLPSHGLPIIGQEAVWNAVENRLRYLENVAAALPKQIPLEEALAGCTIDFLHKEWHAGMYED